MDKKYGGVVTNWQIHNLSYAQEMIDIIYPGMNATPMVFTGTVVSSPRWEKGFHMRSSLIVNINEDRSRIETLNTIYDVVNEGGDVFDDIGDDALKIFY